MSQDCSFKVEPNFWCLSNWNCQKWLHDDISDPCVYLLILMSSANCLECQKCLHDDISGSCVSLLILVPEWARTVSLRLMIAYTVLVWSRKVVKLWSIKFGRHPLPDMEKTETAHHRSMLPTMYYHHICWHLQMSMSFQQPWPRTYEMGRQVCILQSKTAVYHPYIEYIYKTGTCQVHGCMNYAKMDNTSTL